jgi:hypothetical protein
MRITYPSGRKVELMSYDDYIADEKIKALKEKMYR